MRAVCLCLRSDAHEVPCVHECMNAGGLEAIEHAVEEQRIKREQLTRESKPYGETNRCEGRRARQLGIDLS
jgi:hypothetical protein